MYCFIIVLWFPPLSVPEPSVLVSVTEGTVAYVGNNLTLECSIRLSPAISYSEVEVEVRWLKDGRVYGGQIGEAEISHGSTQSEISFTYLLESDSGWYDCEAILSPRDVRVNSPQLVTSTIYNLTAIGMYTIRRSLERPHNICFIFSAIIDSSSLAVNSTYSRCASLQ